MKYKLLITIIVIALLILIFYVLPAQAQLMGLWKYVSSLLQPINSSWTLYSPDDFRFDDEIKPDGDLCANNQILKKTGADDWDCAADNTGSAGTGYWTYVLNGTGFIYVTTTTDDVVIGNNATSGAEFWMDISGKLLTIYDDISLATSGDAYIYFDAGTDYLLWDDGGDNFFFSNDVTTNQYMTAAGFTGNASTATALAADPSDCAANQFAQSIVASGNLTCAAIADADVPDTITIDLASAATALAANGANCNAGEIPLGVDTVGAVEGCYEPAEADISDLVHLATAITDDLIINADLNIDVEASDADYLQYDSTGDNFTWRSATEMLGELGAIANDWDGSGDVTITEADVSDADWWDADADIDADEISEGKIAFSTACASGNHYYLNGNDLACEADDDTTYTVSNPITLNGTVIGFASSSDLADAYTHISSDGSDHSFINQDVTSGANPTFGYISGNLTGTASSSEDLTCTDCINATEIEDIYLVNNADDTTTGYLTAAGFTGKSSTTAALAANPSNCSAGSYPLGIDENGDVESCTDATTEINSEIGNVLDGTDAFTDFNGNNIIDTDNLNWGNFTDLGEGGAVTWGNLGAGELADNSIIDADIDDDGAFAFTGSWDFGGAVLEITNGANPTVDASGEIALDTTDNQLLVGDSGNNAVVFGKKVVKIWSATIASTSVSFSTAGLLKIPTELDGYTMTNIRCSVQGGTSKVIAIEDEATNSTEDITCTTSVTSDDGSITNATVTAGEEMYIDFGATTGVVNYIAISVFGTWTRE